MRDEPIKPPHRFAMLRGLAKPGLAGDRVRARAHGVLARVPGRVGERLRGVNEALGRPLADAGELADRRAFRTGSAPAGAASSAGGTAPSRAQAPVFVYHLDKTRRDVPKLTDILDANGVTYTVVNLEGDPAAQAAVRRDSKGARLPVVFVAGECLGGREHLVNAASTGELAHKVRPES
jgi:glutaredoxin